MYTNLLAIEAIYTKQMSLTWTVSFYERNFTQKSFYTSRVGVKIFICSFYVQYYWVGIYSRIAFLKMVLEFRKYLIYLQSIEVASIGSSMVEPRLIQK